MLTHSLKWLLLGALAAQHSVAEPLFRQQTPDITINSFHTAQEAAVLKATTDLLAAESLVASCSSCISLLQVVKNLAIISESLFLSTLISVCKRSGFDPIVCEGTIREQGPVLRHVLRTINVSGKEGHIICAATIDSCPYPVVDQWNLTFPSPKPVNAQPPAPSGQEITVLHLSDWHVDPFYETGAEAACDKPICCRPEFTNYENITQPASIWGAYTCDTPITLLESMLEYIPSVTDKYAFAILTGDVPPHEVWSTLPYNKTQGIETLSYDLLHAHFDTPGLIDTKLYPVVGNHEAAPTNLFPHNVSKIPKGDDNQFLNLTWLYETMSDSWSGWLDTEATFDLVHNSGSYIAYPTDGLVIIGLNTMFCYTLNWWNLEGGGEKDPNGIFQWMIHYLQKAEDEGKRVWIIGHIAPGDNTCLHDYSNYYYQIVERYAPHVIAGQFFGHTHRDELEIFYENATQKAGKAISTAYLAPSMTPFSMMNPGFRVYKIDAVTFEVMDSLTYVADLDQVDEWDETGPNWHLEYSAREAYSSSEATLGHKEPLSPAWWHNVTKSFEESDSMFEKYYNFRSKSSPDLPECDQACRTNLICGIRAGKSELRCDYQRDDGNQTSQVSLFSERQRNPEKYAYMKDLCSGLDH
ncbi:hypothetical protein INT44_003403 [Umbelopsis vinacea]|uniref:Sphingomyelin phosphodiesterase n=1 Tax=Umbelopsis vinacea TaxID=44442 RepID=A0A8H7UIL1_9FUNG|nr:hypothetical protein INT44_003403 [Umbelopsis vinacea]KAI9289127.1 Metallo-dependent phosphatase-like protein [Umbelopsis sp. AD052]